MHLHRHLMKAQSVEGVVGVKLGRMSSVGLTTGLASRPAAETGAVASHVAAAPSSGGCRFIRACLRDRTCFSPDASAGSERAARAQRKFDRQGSDGEAPTRLANVKMWRWSPLGGIRVLTGGHTYSPRPATTRYRAMQG